MWFGFAKIIVNIQNVMTGAVKLILLTMPLAVSNRWTGLLEWTTGMDYWNGL